MTNTQSIFTELLADCNSCGIRLSLGDGGGITIDAPHGALTPDLMARLKANKGELVAMLRPVAELGTCEDCGQALTEMPTLDGFFNLECLGCDRCFGCRPATAEVAAQFQRPPESANSIVELIACPECGSLGLWHVATRNLYGVTPGRWRCINCCSEVGEIEKTSL